MRIDNNRKPSKWRKLSSENLADYELFKFLRCRFENVEKAQTGDFFLVQCDDWVQVIAETVDKNFLLVEQYRFGLEDFSLELPGGRMDKGESAVDAARRELIEETGFSGDSAELIARILPNPAFQTNIVNVVLIRNCRKIQETNFDEFEDLTTLIVSRQKLLDLVRAGKISHCISIAAITKYFWR